ncbi:Retrotransposon-like protein 1 [Colletotrichum aenigma]|uniref:Retrotransposon-like protein 1 n=1 Tax=Colletotrichum aenigma TaxID=1215731 RepID=UPI00187257D5|nr:Retrotransposon-like protein 1 [Colletotrichum aenigma]KAF5524098.1 Retrotransposon-like protein 1 [Colletotrichum aenigma]
MSGVSRAKGKERIGHIAVWCPRRKPLSPTKAKKVKKVKKDLKPEGSTYSEIAGPLIALTKKGVLFCWGKEQEAAFQELKRIFAAKPVLHQLNPKRTTYVEADCSGFALRGVLS